MTMMTPSITIPENLEAIAIDRFDKLVSQGEIFYQEPVWKQVKDESFTANFLLSPSLSKKPMLSAPQPRNPFLDPDPAFVLSQIGPDHTLILNKFCVSRPMYLLHTKTHQSQSDDLNLGDLTAVWEVLMSLDRPHMVIYNCGAESGASQGHKHMQLFPKPERKDAVLFPDEMELSYDEIKSNTNIPYQNFIIRLEPGITATQVLSKYEKLLAAAKKLAGAYNLIMVPEWLVLVPRSHANVGGGKAATNAAGMMGMLWVKDDEEVDLWRGLGIRKHLAFLGVGW